MIYFSNADGTITKIVSKPIYKGSNAANEIVLIAPFANTNLVTYAYTLPNGISSSENLVMSEGEVLGNIVDVEGNQYSMWRAYVDSAMTSQSGDVSIQFFVYSGDEIISTMQTLFSIGPGQRNPLPNSPSENIYQQILNYLATMDANIDYAIDKANSAEYKAKQAEEYADTAMTDASAAYSLALGIQSELDSKQDKLTAGDNVTIEGKVISVTIPDMQDYIKSTDYASKEKGGTVRVFNASDSTNTTGLTISGNGVISQFVPTTKLIDDRGVTSKGTFTNPITVNTLDYAIKSGLTASTLTLTEEEQALACAWLGATKLYKHTFTLVENVNGEPIEFFITSPTEKYDIESENINLEIGSSANSLNFATMIGIMENANFNTYKVCFSIQITKTGDLWTITVVGDGIYKFWEGTRLSYSYSEV